MKDSESGTTKEGGMAVSAVWRLVYFLATQPTGIKRAYLGARANLHTDLQMNRIRNISVFAHYFRQIILRCWIHF